MRRGFLTRSFSVAVVAKAYGEPGRQLGGSDIDTAAVVRRHVKSPPIMTHRRAVVMRWCAVSVGEFASRNAAFLFAERLEGPYSIRRGPARTSKSSAGKERPLHEKTATLIKAVPV